MNLDGSTYTLTDTENLLGVANESVTPVVKTYTGFTSPETQTKTITSDGSMVVDYYYTRNKYYIDLNGTLDEVWGTHINNYGMVDVYVNGNLVAENVSDYFIKHFYGSTYEIKNIEPYIGKTYIGVKSGELKGTIGASDVPIELIFKSNTYTINYELNGGTAGTNAPTSAKFDEVITIDNPTKANHDFAGWTVTSGLNTETAKYGVDDTTVISSITSTSTKIMSKYFKNLNAQQNGSVTLTANFTENTYTLRLNGNGVEVNPSEISITYNGTYSNLPTPTRDGYTFVGWFIGNTEIKNGDTVTLTGNAEAVALWKEKAATYIQNLYVMAASNNGLTNSDPDRNIRYTGAINNVRNKIWFNCKDNYEKDGITVNYGDEMYEYNETNCELWRIIGVFDTKANENDMSGTQRIKIVRDKVLTDNGGKPLYMEWDTTTDNVTNVNQWGTTILVDNTTQYAGASLMQYLRDTYYSSLSEESKLQIEQALWYTGAVSYNNGNMPRAKVYEEERSNLQGSSTAIKYTKVWEGNVGLIYPSDYGYAGTDCDNAVVDSCGSSNSWLPLSSEYYYWTISPRAEYPDQAWTGSSYGRVSAGYVYSAFAIRPSVYLSSEVEILDGNGYEEPYVIKRISA